MKRFLASALLCLALAVPSLGQAVSGKSSPVLAAVPTNAATLACPTLITPFQAPSQIITRFQAGHGWTLGSGATGNLNDTTDACPTGNQCVSVATKGAGAQANIHNYAITSFSATAKAIRVTVRITNAAHLQTLAIYAGDTSLANCWIWTVQTLNADMNSQYFQEGQWLNITLNWADAAISSGTPNRAAITGMSVALYDDNTGQIVSGLINAVETVPDGSAVFPNGVISICFDDSYGSEMTLSKPALDVYGWPATTNTIVSLVGGTGKVTLPWLQQVQDQAGWEVAGHAFTDADHSATFTSISNAALIADFQGMVMWAKNNGIKMTGVAYPQGDHNAAVLAAAKQYFSYARTVFRRPTETGYPSNIFKLRATSTIGGVGGVTAVSLTTTTTGTIDLCKANATWLILIFHDIVTTTPTLSTQCLLSDFNAILAKINADGIPVMPVRNVLQKLGW